MFFLFGPIVEDSRGATIPFSIAILKDILFDLSGTEVPMAWRGLMARSPLIDRGWPGCSVSPIVLESLLRLKQDEEEIVYRSLIVVAEILDQHLKG